MRIGDLARLGKVSQRSLRYYEAQGLLKPGRTPAGHRVFERTDLERVRTIKDLFAAGFCSGVIRDLLPRILEPGARGSFEVVAVFRVARNRLQQELEATRQELAALAALGSRLGLAPDMHVRSDDDEHATHDEPTQATATDHRSRRLR